VTGTLDALRRRLRGLRLPPAKKLWVFAAWAVPAVILLGTVSVWRTEPPLAVEFRNRVFDSFNRQWPRESSRDLPVRVIDIDEESLKRVGQWPWPRSILAELVTRLHEGGAAVIALDMVFPERDRTSPAHFAESLPDAPDLAGVRARLKSLGDNDEIFGKAVQNAPVVTGFVLSSKPNKVFPRLKAIFFVEASMSGVHINATQLERAAGNGRKIELDQVVGHLPQHFGGAVDNLRVIGARAKGNGCFVAVPDPDNIIRRVPVVFKHGPDIFPSLAAEALRVALGSRGFRLNASAQEGLFGVEGVSILKTRKESYFDIPTDDFGNVLLFDSGSRPERFIPAWKVLAGGEDAPSIEGAIVFVGTSAEGLKDQRGTPLNPAVAGVEVHAQIAEQVLSEEYLLRPGWAGTVEDLFVLLVGIVLIILMARLGAAWCALLAGLAVAGAGAGAWYGYTELRYLIDPVYPSLTVLAVYTASSFINYLRTESEKKQVRGAFSQYLSPALVEQLAADPTKLRLGGEMKELTLMFSDIRGFTTISEQFDAQGLTHFINRYLTPMTTLVLDRGGTIDKYMGDCIMAFWNAPLDDPEHARHACLAALIMRDDLNELNKEWEAEAEAEGRKYIPIRAGIGLNTGPCCVGNMGSDQRFDYSVLGDDVNLASRLEGQSKNYGVDIVIGPKTREAVPELAAIELDLIKVKGKTEAVHIYALLGNQEKADAEAFKDLAAKHAAMLAAYRSQNWDEAGGMIADCRDLEPALGKLYDLYTERIKACKAEPPGPDWDGAFTATTK